MEETRRLFRTETAGSLVPNLEGMPASARHESRMTDYKKETNGRASIQQAKRPRKQAPGERG